VKVMILNLLAPIGLIVIAFVILVIDNRRIKWIIYQRDNLWNQLGMTLSEFKREGDYYVYRMSPGVYEDLKLYLDDFHIGKE